MEIVNDTPFETAVVPMTGLDGNPGLVVVIKATFAIPTGGPIEVASEQIPVLFKDEYNDPMETGSVKFESDLVPFKPKADVVLVGKAHAPPGRALNILDVTLRVGGIKKTLRIFGDRVWKSGMLLSATPSTPKPFASMDLIYERSFGGVDGIGGQYCERNLVGTGFMADKAKEIDGKILPNIEDPGMLIKSVKDRPQPAGFGFYGKAWVPRINFLEQGEPGQYNGAHPDLQVEGYLQGGEEVELEYLCPEGRLAFQLPDMRVNAVLSRQEAEKKVETPLKKSEMTGYHKNIELCLDTLCIMPDEKEFYLVWRGFHTLQAGAQPEEYDVTIS